MGPSEAGETREATEEADTNREPTKWSESYKKEIQEWTWGL